jgi:aminoglycoside phosphotransferase family enzyme/predicted kinase
VEAAALAETHSAVVVLIGDRAYKVKKPVDLGVLDFTTVERRRRACEDEVRLNRRIAPDVYLGVAEVLDVDGAVCDHLVVMRRMPADRRLSTLVVAGEDVTGPLRSVAHQLAALHAGGARTPAADEAAGVDATRARWVANTDQLLQVAGGDLFDDVTVGTVHGLATRYLDGRHRLLEGRVAAGRAVDGHGDLLADDVFCLRDGPRVLDCLDFDERLRLGDALADAAFLAMDLERLGRAHLGTLFLAAYREYADDAWPPSLAHHHIAYRAQVRAKVAAIRAGQGAAGAASEGRELLAMALRHLEAGRVRLVLVGGLPGTGKSTLAKALGHRLDAVVLRSDEVRKELAGVPALTRMAASYGEGIYEAGSTARTYDVLLDRAETALAYGESVVLDASWSDQEVRARARTVARRTDADLAELRCTAPRRWRRSGSGAGRRTSTTPATPHRRSPQPWPRSGPPGRRRPRSTPAASPATPSTPPPRPSGFRSGAPATAGRCRPADGRGARRSPRGPRPALAGWPPRGRRSSPPPGRPRRRAPAPRARRRRRR